MKRDLELIRYILMKIEADNNFQSSVETEDFYSEEYSEELVQYNLKLLFDHGIIEGESLKFANGGMGFLINGLTWQGHDFLDASRDEKRWAQAKSVLNEVKDFSIELAMKVLTQLAFSAAQKAMGM